MERGVGPGGRARARRGHPLFHALFAPSPPSLSSQPFSLSCLSLSLSLPPSPPPPLITQTPAQAAALRRKVGGTAKDYWKGWVEVKGENVDKGYVVSADEAAGLPPAVGLLALTLLGMLGVVGVVVQRT